MTHQETKRTATVPPEEISSELMPIVEELGLVENCRQLAGEGYTIVRKRRGSRFRCSTSQHHPGIDVRR